MPRDLDIIGAELVDVAINQADTRAAGQRTYEAIARIPEGAIVRFLPVERTFDNFNRECVFVEYVGETSTKIGWILLADLAGP